MKLDSIGCELNCSTITDHTQDYKFVIARNEVSYSQTFILSFCHVLIPQAVYFYTPEGRAQAFAFEGNSISPHTHTHTHYFSPNTHIIR